MFHKIAIIHCVYCKLKGVAASLLSFYIYIVAVLNGPFLGKKGQFAEYVLFTQKISL